MPPDPHTPYPPTTPHAGDRAPRCAQCRYDLSGAPPAWTQWCPLTGTCPECGAAFTWKDAFAAAHLAPAWLFEYAAQAGPRAWLACAARALLPSRLFDEARGVSPATPVLTPRVWRFAILSLLLSHAVVAILTTVHTVDRLRPALAFGTPPQRNEAMWRAVVPLVWPYGGMDWTRHWSYRPMLGTAWWMFTCWALLIGPAMWFLSRAIRRDADARARLLRASCYSTALIVFAMACWSGAFTGYVLNLWPRSSALSTRMTGLVYSAWLPAGVMAAWVAWYWLGPRGAATHALTGSPWKARALTAASLVLAALVAGLIISLWPGTTLLSTLRAIFTGA